MKKKLIITSAIVVLSLFLIFYINAISADNERAMAFFASKDASNFAEYLGGSSVKMFLYILLVAIVLYPYKKIKQHFAKKKSKVE